MPQLKKRMTVDFLMQNWMIALVALTSGLALVLPAITKGAGGGVGPAHAVLMMNRDKAVVIDVCEPAEFAAGHILGARNVPLGQLETQLPQAVKNKSTPIILTCQSGARSGRAVAVARKLGYEKVQNLSGGLKGWQAAHLPVEKA